MKIRVIDELGPEDSAMLQALYSRSAESVDVHLEKVRRTGSGKFMSSYYVGYGHNSIGDCGSTTIFIEGVSLLAAKAIQDWPLYSGQETSTRYIDMAKQRIIHPFGEEGDQIIARWMRFYESSQTAVRDHVRAAHPRLESEDEAVYERAVRARTFDILRGFLPAGVTTQLSWHTNLRQARDHLRQLWWHPLEEVRVIVSAIANALNERYGNSGFTELEPTINGSDWQVRHRTTIAYPGGDLPLWRGMPSHIDLVTMNIDNNEIRRLFVFRELLSSRPKGSLLPHAFSVHGPFRFQFDLDFGSFRDLQRHRNGVVAMPIVGPHVFEPWYVDQLPSGLQAEAKNLVETQTRDINRISSIVDRQYVCALGYRVPANVTMNLPSLVYFLELRSSKTVHPTLRAKVIDLVHQFRSLFPHIALHADTDPDDWTVRRGSQTIVEKVEASS